MPGYICIHGHFYQPPRENPWLEAVELQDSAYPFHDWNERITSECYAPNAASRILDDKGLIASITNNYSRISFNFGPTLLSWLEARAPETYRAILEADVASRRLFAGHGSAMAQNYGHLIMPLANQRDRITQVRWGRRDFEHRFGRPPEGMWLAECAVDIDTLETLVDHGIRFTVLSPYQAARVADLGDDKPHWHDVSGGRIDPRRAYLQELPSGRSIALFFYDGPVSQAVAFERLLAKGENFAARLIGLLDRPDTSREALAHIATDGETYGHHHTHGDMALAYALRLIGEGGRHELTNYGAYLSEHPPRHRVEIQENTSWSCAHGVERWRASCGCHSGAHPTWNQRWRAPLRAALDWLRDEVSPKFEEVGGRYFQDPWAARDDYIGVILDRSTRNVEAFLARHGTYELPNDRKVTALRLMELQRHAMLMYTSCGWFFDDISGIETVQVIQYAGRVIQLARQVFGVDLNEAFATRLEAAESNVPSQKNGRVIYETHVKPFAISLNDVGAHYAVTSLFEQYPLEASVYCYDVTRHEEQQHKAGKMKLTLGRARIRSRITWEAEEVSYAAVHFGDHNVYGGVDPHMATEDFHVLERAVSEAFNKGDLPRIVRVLDKHFGGRTFSLGSLFRDEQRKLLDALLQTPLSEAEVATQRIFRQNAPLMRYLAGMGIPAPRPLHLAAEFALNSQLRRALEDDPMDGRAIAELLDEARDAGVELASTALGYTLSARVERKAHELAAAPEELARVQALETAVDVARAVPFAVALSEAQTIYYRLLVDTYQKVRAQTDGHNGPVPADQVPRWLDHFANLGRLLKMRVP